MIKSPSLKKIDPWHQLSELTEDTLFLDFDTAVLNEF